ncbi:MAG: hypothetical protein V3581_01670 [Candidatus Cardinium sp.]
MESLHEIQGLLNNYDLLGIENLKKNLSIQNEYSENLLHHAANNNKSDILNKVIEPLYDNHCTDILQAEDKNGSYSAYYFSLQGLSALC